MLEHLKWTFNWEIATTNVPSFIVIEYILAKYSSITGLNAVRLSADLPISYFLNWSSNVAANDCWTRPFAKYI